MQVHRRVVGGGHLESVCQVKEMARSRGREGLLKVFKWDIGKIHEEGIRYKTRDLGIG